MDAYVRHARPFPGVLFHASSVRHADVGHHVRALQEWIESATGSGVNPVENGLGWLR